MATDPATDVVNEALAMVNQRDPLVTGVAPTFDNSPAGKMAQLIYEPTVQAVGRMFEWDMARRTVQLTPTGNAILYPVGWTEYRYPTNGIQVWQLVPGTSFDEHDPRPVNWQVANAVVNGDLVKVILTETEEPVAIYNNNPGPEVWDSIFRETVVRALAAKFAEGLSGRPETASYMLNTAGAFGQSGMKRPD